MTALHHNPDEWIEPKKFIPERFDPSSPYYLTPSGKKRHPMSYGPFLGGKRVCLGKSLAEVMSRIIGAAIIYQFEFELTDPKQIAEKPFNNLLTIAEPEIMMKLKTNL